MATVQLADVYQPVPFNQAVQEAAIERNNFLQSGVMVNDQRIAAMASVGGNTGDIPFYNALSTGTEPNYTTDNPAVNSTPLNNGDNLQKYMKAMQHQSWSAMDLARELSLADPLGAITGRIGHYWSVQTEKRVIQSAMGILADNSANDAGDMIYSIATDDVGAVTDAERISQDAVVEAASTMGDAKESLSLIAMHSVVAKKLEKQGLVTTEHDNQGLPLFQMYANRYRVIVDDSLPAIAGVNRITYTTILYGAGSVAYGEGQPQTPSELERVASSGNGGGETIVHSRRTEIILPYGTSFVAGSVAGQSPTQAELALAANWDRVYNRKNVNIAFLQTNG